MKHIININNFLNESSNFNNKPDFFKATHYRLPNEKELIDINSFNLNADEILNGFYYNIVGRGILSLENKNKIIESIQLLVNMYSDNIEYKKALEESKALKNR